MKDLQKSTKKEITNAKLPFNAPNDRINKILISKFKGERIPRKIKKWFKKKMRGKVFILDEMSTLSVEGNSMMKDFYQTTRSSRGSEIKKEDYFLSITKKHNHEL